MKLSTSRFAGLPPMITMARECPPFGDLEWEMYLAIPADQIARECKMAVRSVVQWVQPRVTMSESECLEIAKA